jgi:CRISPR type III-A-associated protein Csm2
MANQRQCESCNKLFTPKEPHHKRCSDCARKPASGGRVAPPDRSNLLPQFDGYLKQLSQHGYFNEQGYLRAELRVEEAEMVARVLVGASVTTAQLRRFFTMARSLEQRLTAGHSFDAIVPDIASLQPFAAALVGREQNLAQRRKLEVLRSFIDTNARLAKQDSRSFHEGFVPHFESVIAYFTYHKVK